MKRLLLCALAVLCMADDCDPPKKEGVQGTPCYQNGSCDWGLTCLQWKDKRGATNSACANPLDVKVGYAELVRCEAKTPECPKCEPTKCPDPPTIHIAELRCPQPPPVQCPEIKACMPGWHR